MAWWTQRLPRVQKRQSDLEAERHLSQLSDARHAADLKRARSELATAKTVAKAHAKDAALARHAARAAGRSLLDALEACAAVRCTVPPADTSCELCELCACCAFDVASCPPIGFVCNLCLVRGKPTRSAHCFRCVRREGGPFRFSSAVL
jgi:hypothetical protein